jgi:hypothetical protein
MDATLIATMAAIIHAGKLASPFPGGANRSVESSAKEAVKLLLAVKKEMQQSGQQVLSEEKPSFPDPA